MLEICGPVNAKRSIAATCKLSEVRKLIGLINEAYLFLNNSPKRQQLFELTLKEYLPENSHSKLPGLCKTRWVERHTCLDVFLEMYELLVTFLDAAIFPHEYPLVEPDICKTYAHAICLLC